MDLEDFVKYFAYFELALYIFSFPFLVSFTVVLARKRIFHPNLMVLMLSIGAALFVALISRTTMLLMELFLPTFTNNGVIYSSAKKIGNLGVYAVAFTVISMVIERITASIMSKSYEKFCSQIPYLGIALCFLQWTLCCLLLYIYYEGYVSVFVLLGILCCLYFIALLIFCALPIVAKSGYAKVLRRLYGQGEHSLTERYQLSENLRCARLLNRVIIVLAASAFFSMGCVSLHRFVTSVHGSKLLVRIYFLAPPVQTILMTVVLFQASHKLHTEFVRLFCFHQLCLNRFVQPTSPNKATPKLAADEERRIYFESYNRAWN